MFASKAPAQVSTSARLSRVAVKAASSGAFCLSIVSLMACGATLDKKSNRSEQQKSLGLTSSGAAGIAANGYPYCTNGSNTGSGYGWDTSVTDPNGSHSCVVHSASTTYPVCTNGSNTGGGYGWDTSVTDPKGSHSCLVATSSQTQATSVTASTARSSSSSTGANGYPYCTNGSNTGGGYGWDTSITDPKGSHSCLVPTSSTSSSTSSSSNSSTTSSTGLPALNVDAPANSSFQISSYGVTLQTNKQNLYSAALAAGASSEEAALVIAMAMQETTLMEISQRDASKDGTPSANVSILNLNYDMISKLGYTQNDNGASLNDPANLSKAVGYLLNGFRTWGVEKTLDYQRGGYTGFSDGVSYGVAGYRSAIATIYLQISESISLETDGRRVEINVVHV